MNAVSSKNVIVRWNRGHKRSKSRSTSTIFDVNLELFVPVIPLTQPKCPLIANLNFTTNVKWFLTRNARRCPKRLASKNLSWSSAQNVHPDQRHPTFHLQLPNSLRTLSPLISTSHFMMNILFHIFKIKKPNKLSFARIFILACQLVQRRK